MFLRGTAERSSLEKETDKEPNKDTETCLLTTF